MKSRWIAPYSIGLLLAFKVSYVLLGFVIWRSGFIPANRSVIDTLAMIIFVLMVVLLPIGLLSVISYARAARREADAQNLQRAFELRRRAAGTLISNIVEFGVGLTGYYLISRQTFPQIESVWIVLILGVILASVRIWFTRQRSVPENSLNTN
jgi:hypothetical protein